MPRAAGLAALAATISAEVPLVSCRVAAADTAAVGLAETILAELGDAGPDRYVRYAGGTRLVRRWVPASLPETGLQGAGLVKVGGGYLITGGAGGLAGHLAGHLLGLGANVVLAGRRSCPEALAERVESWRQQGREVHYVRADVTDRGQVEALIGDARRLMGRLDGVIHCAGSTRDAVFFRMEPEQMARTWSAKVAGTVHLDAATRDCGLDFFAVFSSLAGLVPNPGQADYALGNAFQYEYVREMAARRADRCLAVAWPLWDRGGMRPAERAVTASRLASGMSPLPTVLGMRLLERALASSLPAMAVVHGDPGRIGGVLPQVPDQAPSPAAGSSAGPSPAPDDLAIAVIGLAGQYPGAPDVATFWRNLAAGLDCVTEIPPDRWDHDAIFDPDQDAPGRTYSRWGGFLAGVDQFDPGFFGISRRDAQRMDPQERLFLLTCWRAVEDAGHQPRGTRTGVFAGIMWNHYQLFTDGGVAPAAMHASVANRVSYCLDLHGPSLAVDTACSSSLTAVHLAVESLRRGECDMALAGGVNVTIHPQKYLQLAQGRFLSADGRCRSFGADGSGYVPGEGVGAVLLKPLTAARRDRDQIYGVIRATALNHTGRTSGFTVPSPHSQAELIGGALAQAAFDPGTVGCVEAHGTGTALGDPIEIEGLCRAFEGAPPGGCALGSVKSNIGHLESAAGIAGLTKVLLQLRHRELVPTLHAARLNPQIELAGSPFRIQAGRQEWDRPPGAPPRRAGISAFGAGGANAHVLVEEEVPVPRPAAAGPRLVVLSAADPGALAHSARDLAAMLREREHVPGGGIPPAPVIAEPAQVAAEPIRLAAEIAAILGVPPDAVDADEPLGDLGFDAAAMAFLSDRLGGRPVDAGSTIRALTMAAPPAPADDGFLADLAYTLQVGRQAMPCRLAIVASSEPELAAALDRYLRSDADPGRMFTGGTMLPDADVAAALAAGRLPEVAAHWAAGGAVAWDGLDYDDFPVRRVSLPSYPFSLERCWIGQGRPSGGRTGPAAGVAVSPPPAVPSVPAAPPLSAGPVRFSMLDDGIALVAMDDREGRNMFTAAMMAGLEGAFVHIAERPDIKAVILAGTGEVFSMGATPAALETLAEGGSRFTDSPFIYEGLLRCDRPVIAAIGGHASGGGLAFGLYADVVVMARESLYSANFVALGFTPGMGATHILTERFGPVLATEMFFTGRAVPGEELERRGAGVRFAARPDVLPVAVELARAAATMPAQTVRILKRDLADRALGRLTPVIERESRMHELAFGAGSAELIRTHFAKVRDFSVPSAEAQEAPPSAEAQAPQAAPPSAVASAGPLGSDRHATGVIEEVLCANLYLEPSEIGHETPFNEMGLDSIGAVELVHQLNRAFGLSIDSVAVYDHPTVRQLTGHVGALLAEQDELLRRASTVTASPAAHAMTVGVAASDYASRPAAPVQHGQTGQHNGNPQNGQNGGKPGGRVTLRPLVPGPSGQVPPPDRRAEASGAAHAVAEPRPVTVAVPRPRAPGADRRHRNVRPFPRRTGPGGVLAQPRRRAGQHRGSTGDAVGHVGLLRPQPEGPGPHVQQVGRAAGRHRRVRRLVLPHLAA